VRRSLRRALRGAVPLATALVVAACPAAAAPVDAGGAPSDPLGQCFVRSTTAEQRTLIVRWIFAMGALHPDVQAMSNVTPSQRDRLNRDTADLVQRLLTQTCRAEAVQGLRTEGLQVLQRSFGTLSQVALQELVSEPHVAAGIGGMVPYLDLPSLLELGAAAR
jgi:hypothetical protein